MQAVGGDEVRGLKLPVGVDAVDDLEAEREPLDGLERGGRVAAPGPSGRFSLKTISGSIFGEVSALDREVATLVAAA